MAWRQRLSSVGIPREHGKSSRAVRRPLRQNKIILSSGSFLLIGLIEPQRPFCYITWRKAVLPAAARLSGVSGLLLQTLREL